MGVLIATTEFDSTKDVIVWDVVTASLLTLGCMFGKLLVVGVKLPPESELNVEVASRVGVLIGSEMTLCIVPVWDVIPIIGGVFLTLDDSTGSSPVTITKGLELVSVVNTALEVLVTTSSVLDVLAGEGTITVGVLTVWELNTDNSGIGLEIAVEELKLNIVFVGCSTAVDTPPASADGLNCADVTLAGYGVLDSNCTESSVKDLDGEGIVLVVDGTAIVVTGSEIKVGITLV